MSSPPQPSTLENGDQHPSQPTPSATTTTAAAPSKSTTAVLTPSAPVPSTARPVTGLDFNLHSHTNITVLDLITSIADSGFQSSAISEAVSILNDMRLWRDPSNPSTKATIFLGYTSNLVSSGLRSVLCWLVEHECVDAIVTTAGGVEEDLIKCLAPTYRGNWADDGAELRKRGMNRVGDLLVPNSNYCAFEDWVVPILDEMLREQEDTKHLPEESEVDEDVVMRDNAVDLSPLRYPALVQENRTRKRKTRVVWSPSRITRRLGRLINHPTSILHQAYLHSIPIYCPALTDGSLGDMLYFHTYRTSPLVLDISVTRDIRALNDTSLRAAKAGMLILGAGVVKHHIANACLMRNGADWAVFVNTAQEYDGSDAGARPDEAVSWGKIKSKAEGGRSVKVYGEASVILPLLVACSFAKVEG